MGVAGLVPCGECRHWCASPQGPANLLLPNKGHPHPHSLCHYGSHQWGHPMGDTVQHPPIPQKQECGTSRAQAAPWAPAGKQPISGGTTTASDASHSRTQGSDFQHHSIKFPHFPVTFGVKFKRFKNFSRKTRCPYLTLKLYVILLCPQQSVIQKCMHVSCLFLLSCTSHSKSLALLSIKVLCNY